jgi:hypothetical protein
VQQFGIVHSYTSDDFGSDVEWRGTGFSLLNGEYIGENQFYIVGAKMSGKVKISWISNSAHIVRFVEVDSIQENGANQVLWKAD